MPNDIKKLLEGDYVIVCDSNVFLSIYRYSPEYSDFALKCLQAILSSIVVPSIVKYEFSKHSKTFYHSMKKRVKKVIIEAEKQMENAKRKVLSICDNLEQLEYPDIDELREGLSEAFLALIDTHETFFDNHAILAQIADPWKGTDYVSDLMESMTSASQIMTAITYDEIYEICEEGEKRYEASPPIPPGFKDRKEKDGVRKYSDLIIWKEIIRYAKEKQVNIIYVTDD